MSKGPRRLGRGLDSLVSDLTIPDSVSAQPQRGPAAVVSQPTAPHTQRTGSPGATTLPIETLDPNPYQPRHNIIAEDVLSLAKSIEQSGLLQPIAVRPAGARYQIIAGERRWAAAKSIGWTHVPVVVREANDEQMLELALIENIQREDLNAIDRAAAYRNFCERFSLKSEEVARRLGEDRTTVVNYLRLLELPSSIQDLVAGGQISMGHARCLLGVADADRKLELAESVVDNELSVRALEEIVRRERTRRGESDVDKAADSVRPSAHLADIQRRFEDAVRTKVVIREGRRKGSGRIVIEYYSLDDFDRIAQLLGVRPE